MPSSTSGRLASWRSPRSQAETRQGWSVSFTDAAKADLIRQTQEETATAPVAKNGYDCGNNNSSSFMKKMSASLGEAARLRQQCRFAASASNVRSKEETVSLGHCQKSIEAAKAISAFAKGAVACRASGFEPASTSAPSYLGHLGIPAEILPGAVQGIEDKLEKEAYPPRGESGTPSTEAGPSRLGQRGSSQTPSTEAGGAYGRDSTTPVYSPPPPWVEEAAEEAQVQELAALPHSAPEEGERQSSHETNPSHKVSADGLEGDEFDELASSGSDDEEDEEEEEDRWPPRPPLLRFKMVCQFNTRFQPSEGKQMFEKMVETSTEKLVDKAPTKIEDGNVSLWLNRVFQMNVQTTFEFETGFPLIILSILDAIYPKRVRWRQVDWRMQYKRALNKNYALLQAIWAEVNMEKAREFRVENTSLRLEDMPSSTLEQKSLFLKVMKRWFDARSHAAGPYDPQSKRLDIVQSCKAWGHEVKFPPWIIYEKEQEDMLKPRQMNQYDKMPEFKRLIYFLGSTDHQSL
mmetsp:Transcript_68518/g.139372  ORF Transcript_68518/g.139372 Transcript_68518/m.139372 type:complete len:519 (-) Transcript_68518:182-1738(-)